ncbi:MAG: trigger factor [Phycisphaerales bacterium]|jgi:trigger factor|nr:trigger factor [Phycisphaerales bacterium]
MTESSTAAAETEQEFAYPVSIEDAGPGTKKVSVQIPQERIAAKLAEQFKEVRQQAAVPGFRPGHAPQKLVEKRFNTDVREQVRRDLIQESYKQALEKNELQVLGEPEFDNPDDIKLPADGAMSYSFQVEVQPQITLPELKGLKIQKAKVQVTEANVDEAMKNLRQQQGALIPVEDRGVEEGDYIVADVHVKVDDKEITHQHDAQIVARPGRIAGISVDDLAKQLQGAKPDQVRTFTVKAPEGHSNAEIAGKEVQIEIKVKDIKRLELAELNEQFLTGLGFETEQQVRDALREQLDERIKADVQRLMREQVNKYLLEGVNIELPAKLSDRQTDRVVNRRAVDLMLRGIPREEVEGHIEQLRGGAKEEAVRELKLFFILQKVAQDQNVDVDEAELNGRIAMIAAQRDRRPEKLKQEMSKDGSLANLYLQMREQKAIDKILESAQIEEVEPTQAQGNAGASA